MRKLGRGVFEFNHQAVLFFTVPAQGPAIDSPIGVLMIQEISHVLRSEGKGRIVQIPLSQNMRMWAGAPIHAAMISSGQGAIRAARGGCGKRLSAVWTAAGLEAGPVAAVRESRSCRTSVLGRRDRRASDSPLPLNDAPPLTTTFGGNGRAMHDSYARRVYRRKMAPKRMRSGR